MRFQKFGDQPLAQPIAIRLPEDLDRVWRSATSADPAFFGRWAIAVVSLRLGWVDAEVLELLPYLSVDGANFELFKRGEQPEGFIPGWL